MESIEDFSEKGRVSALATRSLAGSPGAVPWPAVMEAGQPVPGAARAAPLRTQGLRGGGRSMPGPDMLF